MEVIDIQKVQEQIKVLQTEINSKNIEVGQLKTRQQELIDSLNRLSSFKENIEVKEVVSINKEVIQDFISSALDDERVRKILRTIRVLSVNDRCATKINYHSGIYGRGAYGKMNMGSRLRELVNIGILYVTMVKGKKFYEFTHLVLSSKKYKDLIISNQI